MRRIRHNDLMPSRWYFPVTFPLNEIADSLTDSEYLKFVEVCPEVKINLHFDYTPAQPAVGIFRDSLEWNGEWSLPSAGNYPQKIKDAITDHLDSIDVDATYGEQAYDSFSDYCDHLRYGSI